MKKIVLFIAALFLLTSCSKNYQKDLTAYPLRGEWLVHAGDNPRWRLPGIAESDWQPLTEDGRLPPNGYRGFLWLRRYFVLPGHFPDKIIYLYLGPARDSLAVYLNGRLIGREGTFSRHFGNLPQREALFQVDPALLHFGKENVLAVRLYFSGNARTPLFPRAALYSRLGFLRARGLPVSACSFKTERELHARLEDFARDWLAGDSAGMAGYFVPDSLQANRRTDLLFREIRVAARQPGLRDIELYRPGFYRCQRDSAVLVLGDWRFHFPDERMTQQPFQWKFVRRDADWYLAAPLILPEGN